MTKSKRGKRLAQVCSYCNGSPWLFRGNTDRNSKLPFIFSCPMCNPYGDRPPIAISRKKMDKFIMERQKIVSKVEEEL